MSFAQHDDFQKRMKRIQSGKGHVAGVTLVGEGEVKKTRVSSHQGGKSKAKRQNPFKLPGALLIGAGAVLAGQKLAEVVYAGATPIPAEFIGPLTEMLEQSYAALGVAALIVILARIFLSLETTLQTLALVGSFCVVAFYPELVSDVSTQVVAMLSSQGILES